MSSIIVSSAVAGMIGYIFRAGINKIVFGHRIRNIRSGEILYINISERTANIEHVAKYYTLSPNIFLKTNKGPVPIDRKLLSDNCLDSPEKVYYIEYPFSRDIEYIETDERKVKAYLKFGYQFGRIDNIKFGLLCAFVFLLVSTYKEEEKKEE